MRITHFSMLVATAGLLAGCSVLGTAAVAPALAVSAAPMAAKPVAQPPAPPPPLTHVEPVAAAVPSEPAKAPATDLGQLREQLKSYLEQQDGTYGLYLIDLTTGNTAGINSDTVFPTASTFKLPMALYLLDQAARGRVNLDEEIAYLRSDYEEGTGILQDSIKVGQKVKVSRLIELAITQSDNIATQMLMRRYGYQNVYAFMQRLGGKVTHDAPGVPGTTPREMALYMRELPNVLKNDGLRQFLLAALEQTAFGDRTAAGVPRGVKVAHKIGTLPGVINDVALVEAPGHPFIISVFSRGVDNEVAPGVITAATRTAYSFFVGAGN